MRYKCVLVAFLAIVLSVLAPVAAPGLAVTSAYADSVTAIVVEGNQRIENDTILSYVQLTKGQAITAEKIDASVKALFQTGLFSDVQINRRGNTLVVKVVENPMLSLIHISEPTRRS